MKKIISTEQAPAAIGPYSQATVHNGTLYVSGQLPIDPETGELVEGDVTQEAHQVLKNLRAIIEAAGSKMENVLKATVLLTDLGNFAAVNQVYAEYFPANPPARICYQVTALPKGAQVEIDAVCAI